MDKRLRACLARVGLTPEGELAPLSGGDVAAVYRLATDRGDVVVKQDTGDRLAGEAEGLVTLAAADSGLVVPEVLAQGDGWLVMAALEVAPRRRDPAALGEGLRRLHGVVGDAHGWHRDNACGRTPQPNASLADGRGMPGARPARCQAAWPTRGAGPRPGGLAAECPRESDTR